MVCSVMLHSSARLEEYCDVPRSCSSCVEQGGRHGALVHPNSDDIEQVKERTYLYSYLYVAPFPLGSPSARP